MEKSADAPLDEDPVAAAIAIRQIAEKSRFGTLYYLFSLTSIFLIAPGLHLGSWLFAALLSIFVALQALRELSYRLSRRDESIALARRCVEASYLLNGLAWALVSGFVFHSERAMSGTAAVTAIATTGLTAGGVTAIVPHLTLIRRYSLLMMATLGLLLLLYVRDVAAWYVAALCVIYVIFLWQMGRIQCAAYWQLIESNRTLQQQAEALAAARLEAVAGARAKSEFLANMSHEIRTPMNGVLGVAQLLEKSALDRSQRAYLKIIEDAGTTLLTIIDDILDFSKLEAGEMSLHPEPVNLDALAGDLQALFALQLADSPVALRYERSDLLPSWVLIDPARLRQLLFNLIGNAIKFTPRGEIVVRLDYRPSTLASGNVRFSVTDTGIGIAPSDRPQIFTMFKQLAGSPSTKGTGLGLAICKYLVELMGGTIDFSSQPGVGSCFWFELPVTTVTAPAASPPESRAPIARELSVLLVEDNPINQVVAVGLLKHCGCRAEAVISGEEAVAMVRQRSFDLILMDCDMPGMDGFAATRLIREGERERRQPRTPIVALTAHVLDSARKRCIEAGMDDYLAKPIRLRELEAAVGRWSGKAHAASGGPL